MSKASPKIGFVSLGCPKATVDSEHILTRMRAEGYEITPSYQEADLVVVNTCGFIDSAVAESLEAIGEAIAGERQGHRHRLPGRQGRHRAEDASQGAFRHRAARDRCRDERGAPVPAQTARSLYRPGAAARRAPHAAAFRLSEDIRGLQPSLHLLHHPRTARRPGQPPDPRGHERSGETGRVRREGIAGHLAGHLGLRRGPEIPHRLLERQADQDAHDRTGRRAGQPRRMGAPALRVSLSAAWTKSSR